MHASSIRASALAPSGEYVVTGSADKTVRLWELPSLRLRRVFRLPIGSGNEGRVHDVAVSADSRVVAAAGWTGWEWDGSASIYFFDVATGEIAARLSGLPAAVRNLAFSPDGRHLAVGLMGRAGLRIYRTSDFTLVHEDAGYRERIVSLDFARDGRLATASVDGRIRIYSKAFDLTVAADVPAGSTPLEVRFSPDGSRVAIGYHDLPRVDVLDAEDLSLRFSPKVPAAGLEALYAVEWSEDGKTLYAGGRHDGKGRNPILAWPQAGRGKPLRLPASRARMGRLLPLRDGGLFWGAEDPAIGLFARDGSLLERIEPQTLDFQDLGDELRLSADGSAVGFLTSDVPRKRAHYSFPRRGIVAGPPSSFRLHEPRRIGPAPVEVGLDRRSLTIGGRPVPLEPFEDVRHWAWSADGQRLAVATEWAVRVFDANGSELWRHAMPVVVHAVNISRDGAFVVAAISDGTLRWFRLDDGTPAVSLFPHANGEDWAAWLPSGHYAASPRGDRYVGWALNQGANREALFFRAVQFERVFYEPRRIERFPRLASARGSVPLQAKRLMELAPPQVEIEVARQIHPRASGPLTRIRVRAKRRSAEMERFTVYVNKIPLTPFSDRELLAGEREWVDREVEIPLQAQMNDIRVEVDTAHSRAIARVAVENVGEPMTQQQGDLYVLAVGVNFLRNLPDKSLSYAARDARRVGALLQSQEGRVFRNVHLELVVDRLREPDKRGIEDALGFLRRARPIDTVVLFLAGHGIRDVSGNYYFVPSDASREEIVALETGATKAPSLVRWNAFLDGLQSAVGRRVLIVDTCHAQQIRGRLELDWLAKHSASAMFAMLAASAPQERSEENARFGAGLYTQGLLSALSGSGDANQDGVVTIVEAHRAAGDFVKTHRKGDQEPRFFAPPEFSSMALTATPDGTSGD